MGAAALPPDGVISPAPQREVCENHPIHSPNSYCPYALSIIIITTISPFVYRDVLGSLQLRFLKTIVTPTGSSLTSKGCQWEPRALRASPPARSCLGR